MALPPAKFSAYMPEPVSVRRPEAVFLSIHYYTDFKSTVQYIYRTEGAIAFSKGIMARMSINVPSTALSWGTYELIKSFLINTNTGSD